MYLLSKPPRPPAIVGIVGNPKAQSRTWTTVEAVCRAAATATGGEVRAVLDLITLQAGLFDFGHPDVAAALQIVRSAEILVVGSPVYKASYTGLLKAFCDHISQGELAGKLAVPLMVGGSDHHALAVEVHLRPLLVELGATCLTPGFYMLESAFDKVEAIAEAYIATVFGQGAGNVSEE